MADTTVKPRAKRKRSQKTDSHHGTNKASTKRFGYICAVKSCKKYAWSVPKVSMYRFPKDADRCREWARRTGNTDLLELSIDKLHASYRICDSHFVEQDFMNADRKRAGVMKTAVPELHLPVHVEPRPRPVQTAGSITLTDGAQIHSRTETAATPYPGVVDIKPILADDGTILYSGMTNRYTLNGKQVYIGRGLKTSPEEPQEPALEEMDDIDDIGEFPTSPITHHHHPMVSTLPIQQPFTTAKTQKIDLKTYFPKSESKSNGTMICSGLGTVGQYKQKLPYTKDGVVSYITPASEGARKKRDDVKFLKAEIRRLQVRVCQLKKKNEKLSQRVMPKNSHKQSIRKEKLITDAKDFLSGSAHQFFASQIRQANRKTGQGYRWTMADKSLALSLYGASARCYEILSNVFIMPSLSTLKDCMQPTAIRRDTFLGASELCPSIEDDPIPEECVAILEIPQSTSLMQNVEFVNVEGGPLDQGHCDMQTVNLQAEVEMCIAPPT